MNGLGAEYGRYIGSSGRKSRQSTITLCGLALTTLKRGSGRIAEKHIGELPIVIFCTGH